MRRCPNERLLVHVSQPRHAGLRPAAEGTKSPIREEYAHSRL